MFAHVCDVVSTYLRTPDLAHEVGPLYIMLANLGLGGWAGLLTVKALAIVLTSGLFVLYVRQRRSFYPAEAEMPFHDFLHYAHGKNAIRSRKDERWLAPSPKLLAVWMAFTASIGSAAYAFFLAVHNILGTPLLAWMAVAAAPGAIFMLTAIVFWRTLYEDYRHGPQAES